MLAWTGCVEYGSAEHTQTLVVQVRTIRIHKPGAPVRCEAHLQQLQTNSKVLNLRIFVADAGLPTREMEMHTQS